MSTLTRTVTGGKGVPVLVGVAVGGPGVKVGGGGTVGGPGVQVGGGGGVAVTITTTTVCTAATPPCGTGTKIWPLPPGNEHLRRIASAGLAGQRGRRETGSRRWSAWPPENAPAAGVNVGRGVRVGVPVADGPRAITPATEQPTAASNTKAIAPKSTARVRLCI